MGMDYYAMSFDHMDYVDGKRMQITRLVPVTVTQCLPGMIVVKRLPACTVGAVVTLPIVGQPEPAILKVVGDNRYRELTPAERQAYDSRSKE